MIKEWIYAIIKPTTKGGDNVSMVYFLFALELFLIRILAGYDSRYKKGKYLYIKNPALSRALLSSMSIYEKTKRRKSDINKMDVCAIPFYLLAGLVALINVVFLIAPDIPIDPWCIDTGKFIVYADTLNDKISAVAILLLSFSVFGYMAFTIIHSVRDTAPKWTKILVWIIAIIMLLTCVGVSFWLISEMF